MSYYNPTSSQLMGSTSTGGYRSSSGYNGSTSPRPTTPLPSSSSSLASYGSSGLGGSTSSYSSNLATIAPSYAPYSAYLSPPRSGYSSASRNYSTTSASSFIPSATSAAYLSANGSSSYRTGGGSSSSDYRTTERDAAITGTDKLPANSALSSSTDLENSRLLLSTNGHHAVDTTNAYSSRRSRYSSAENDNNEDNNDDGGSSSLKITDHKRKSLKDTTDDGVPLGGGGGGGGGDDDDDPKANQKQRIMKMPSLHEQGVSASTLSKDLRDCLREEFLLCKICFDPLDNPKSLPCLHTFCCECLNHYIDNQRFDTRKFSCPICRRQVYIPKEGAEGFPDSFFVERLRDVLSRRTDDSKCHICHFRDKAVAATHFCLECKTCLCAECADSHHKSKVTAKHSLFKLPDLALTSSDNPKAREHCCSTHLGEPVCFFCNNCHQPICLACTALEHAGHEIEAIQEVRQNFIRQANKLIEQASAELGEVKSQREKLAQAESNISKRKASVKEDVEAVADALIEQIRVQKVTILAELDQLVDYARIESELERMTQVAEQLRLAVNNAELTLQKDFAPIEQLTLKNQVLADLDESLRYEACDEGAFEADKSRVSIQFFSGESDIRLGRLVKTVLPAAAIDGGGQALAADPIIEYTLLSDGVAELAGQAQQFVFKDEVKKHVKSIDGLAVLHGGTASSTTTNNNELVLLSATSERRVQVYDMAGCLKAFFPPRPSKLSQPTAICTWNSNIAVCDAASKAVHIFDHFGRLVHIFGAGFLEKPCAIAATDNGHYVVSDATKMRLSIHANNGDLVNIFQFLKKGPVPRHLASCGNTVYSIGHIGEDVRAWRFSNGCLKLMGVMRLRLPTPPPPPLGPTSSNSNSLITGTSATTAPTLTVQSSIDGDNGHNNNNNSRSNSLSSGSSIAPSGLFVDKVGNVYVSDRSSSSITVYTPSNTAYTIQLTGSAAGISTTSPVRPSHLAVIWLGSTGSVNGVATTEAAGRSQDRRLVVAQAKAEQGIAELVESLTGDAPNMELMCYNFVPPISSATTTMATSTASSNFNK